MKALKIIGIILVVIIGGAAIWMATLDGKYDVKRSVFIEATPEVVYAEVSDFTTWPEWGPWFAKDETMKAEFGETARGQGATYSWTSENQGNGNMEIVEADPGKSMKTAITFDGMGGSNGYWSFESKDGGTEVTWGFKGEMPFFFRFMASGMDAGVGPDFEKGLNNLKERIENRKPTYEFSEVTLSPTTIFYSHHAMPISEMTKEFWDEAYGAIGDYLGEDMTNVTGAASAYYYYWDYEADSTVVDIVMPCASEKKGNAEIMKGESYAGKCIKTVHTGPYEGLSSAHDAIYEYMNSNGIKMGEVAMEVYVVGPGRDENPENWITELYYSVSADESTAGM